jgi:DNA polymerase-3 subunit alpha
MSDPVFIHLRVHSDFSMIDGLNKVGPILEKTKQLNMPAIALTDQMNLFGLIKYYLKSLNTGIKPIIGCDLWLASDAGDKSPFRLTALAKNNKGYQNLTLLISQAYSEGQVQGRPVVKRQWLKEHANGLILLSGAKDGDLGQALLKGNQSQAEQLTDFYQTYFDQHYYVELVRTGRNLEEDYLHLAVTWANQYSLPVVATNEVCFIEPDGFIPHEIRTAIHDGYTLDDSRRPKQYSEQQYLRGPQEMMDCFSDIPEALSNTVEIAKRCNVTIPLGEYVLPNFPTGGMTVEDYLIKVSEQGLENRLSSLFDNKDDLTLNRQAYDERLKIELEVINQMGFPGYFLIVMEFIQWSKDNDILVGPGRGSGAGSLVAYALGITDLDPLEFDLLFERFLNPERVSMPDFDVDFCMDRRDEVIEHVAQIYGRDAVSQIITFGTMAAKAVVRDVGRVLGLPYGFVDKIAKLIPLDPGMTLEKAFQEEARLPELYEQDEQVKELIDMARSLEGVTRNAGKHAGGVVISPTRITDFSPLYYDEHGKNPVTQFDKNDVETAGLVKFDFLGLRTLTIIQWTIQLIAQVRGEQIDITTIPLNDPACFQLLQKAETTAVFQLESRGMKDLIKRLQPDSFEDIIALVALFRPGPLQSGMVDNFIDRKHGREAISYPDENYQHESLKEILEPTYGIILYQEQVMQIAQVMAGYSLGGADLLRRAMGKKKPEEMAKQREVFESGAKQNGIDPELAMRIFDLVEKFAGYGFNKSHSAAYALVSYQTLWLKTHYPAEFMAAVMSADMDNTDKIVTLISECSNMGITLLPPDLNSGQYKFSVDKQNRILYGIGAVKGVGEGPVEAIIQAREQFGLFNDLFDFCNKIDLNGINKRVLEKLVISGAMDNLGSHRASLMATITSALASAEQQSKAESAGQSDMFGVFNQIETESGKSFIEVPEWSERYRLDGEKEVLGLYLTGHPISQYLSEIKHYLQPTRKGVQATVIGLVLSIRWMTNKRSGRRWAILTIDDRSGRTEVQLFPDTFEQFESLLQNDAILQIKGQVRPDEYSGGNTIAAEQVSTLMQVRESHLRAIVVSLQIEEGLDTELPRLIDTIKFVQDGFDSPAHQLVNQNKISREPGTCQLHLHILHSECEVTFCAGSRWFVKPDDALLYDLRLLLGNEKVTLLYH